MIKGIDSRKWSDRRKHNAAYLEYEREWRNHDQGLMDLVRYYKSALEDLEQDLDIANVCVATVRQESAKYFSKQKQ